MKKIIIISVAVLSLFLWPHAGAAQTPFPSDTLPFEVSLEYLFSQVSKKDFSAAYRIMSSSYKKNNSFEIFQQMLTETGLMNLKSFSWNAFNEQKPLTMFKGDFVSADDQVHALTFEFIFEDNVQKIGGIIEGLTLEKLASRFPAKAELQELAVNDLKSIAGFIKKQQTRKMHNYFSTKGKARIKRRDVIKAFRAYKKQKLNVSFPKEASVTLDQTSPQLNSEGMMTISGTYENSASRVAFTLAYDYDWAWKLGSFSLQTTPLKQ